MFSGGVRTIAPTYTVNDQKLTLRPYNAKLGELCQSVCAKIEGPGAVSALTESVSTSPRFDSLQVGIVSTGSSLCGPHSDLPTLFTLLSDQRLHWLNLIINRK